MSLCIVFRMFHKVVSSLLTPEPLNGLNRLKKVKSLKFQAETIGLIAFILGLHLSFKFHFGGFYNGKYFIVSGFIAFMMVFVLSGAEQPVIIALCWFAHKINLRIDIVIFVILIDTFLFFNFTLVKI